MENKTIKEEITDEQAVALLNSNVTTPLRVATKFVPRTILYPVKVEYKPGQFQDEIRAFVRQAEYVSPHKWEQALEVEKKYAKLNKDYAEGLKKAGLEVNMKEPANPLKATIIGTR